MSDPDRLYEDVRYELKSFKTALLVGVYFAKQKELCIEHLKELASLGETFGFEIKDSIACPMRKMDAGTYLGKGKIQELVTLSQELEVEIIVFDDEISPNQQRSLEKFFSKPVIDRTELILEIFAERAQTKEARLQIELAKTRYQLPRLKRLWTHLSRQSAGGGAYLKGEGEKQIEIDRRILKKQIHHLKAQIDEVRKNRQMQRHQRQRTGTPTFAIVGYTNAGKSTLLNRMTAAEVLAEDKLFATLDTTTRRMHLPNHQEVLLIDTVGFIRKTPTTLIAAFKSTLEESLYTDILLHVVDISHPMALEQAQSTLEVIEELGVHDKPIITILNKVDALEDQTQLYQFKVKYPRTVSLSATSGEGMDQLMDLMMEVLSTLRNIYHLKIPQSHYKLVSEVMKEGRVIESEYEGNDIKMTVDIPKRLEHKVRQFVIQGHLA